MGYCLWVLRDFLLDFNGAFQRSYYSAGGSSAWRRLRSVAFRSITDSFYYFLHCFSHSMARPPVELLFFKHLFLLLPLPFRSPVVVVPGNQSPATAPSALCRNRDISAQPAPAHLIPAAAVAVAPFLPTAPAGPAALPFSIRFPGFRNAGCEQSPLAGCAWQSGG